MTAPEPTGVPAAARNDGSAPNLQSRHLRAAVAAERLVRWFAWCCFAVLLAVWFALHVLGDRAWWTVMLLYGPRIVLAAPWLGFFPWLLVDFRRAIVPALVGLTVVVFPIMGFHLGLHRAQVDGGVPYRVLELNAHGGSGEGQTALILAELAERHPDLVVVSECGPDLITALQHVSGYQMATAINVGLCLMARGMVLEWSSRDPHDVWKQGGAGAIARAVVTTPAGPVRVGVVHLATPRNALDMYFDLSELPRQGPITRANMAQRDEESGLARAWILRGTSYPTIIAGDFNLPVESAIYRQYWNDFRNAFGRAGTGTGYTKHTSHWGVRIDHVLTSSDIGTHDSFLGRDVRSDHLPLIADLVLPAPKAGESAR